MTSQDDEDGPGPDTLSDVERRLIEEIVSDQFRREIEAAPIEPSAAVLQRLRASIARPGRLYRFAARVAELLDITLERAKAVLDRVDDPAAWGPLPLPGNEGVLFFSPDRGPRLEGATVGFLRLRPGARFPEHKHLGHEQVFTLAGGFRDEKDGVEYGPGDLQELDAGTSHSFIGVEGPDCLCLGIVLNGIEVGGVKL